MRLFDTHAHINDERFNEDREQMLADCFAAGVEYIMIPSVNRKTCESGIALAETYDNIYAAVGV
ncbi:MAG: TatD family hydrolase, partial [Veillonella sp.]|nr:TatD family hydrolase [Veillonella sp.]